MASEISRGIEQLIRSLGESIKSIPQNIAKHTQQLGSQLASKADDILAPAGEIIELGKTTITTARNLATDGIKGLTGFGSELTSENDELESLTSDVLVETEDQTSILENMTKELENLNMDDALDTQTSILEDMAKEFKDFDPTDFKEMLDDDEISDIMNDVMKDNSDSFDGLEDYFVGKEKRDEKHDLSMLKREDRNREDDKKRVMLFPGLFMPGFGRKLFGIIGLALKTGIVGTFASLGVYYGAKAIRDLILSEEKTQWLGFGKDLRNWLFDGLIKGDFMSDIDAFVEKRLKSAIEWADENINVVDYLKKGDFDFTEESKIIWGWIQEETNNIFDFIKKQRDKKKAFEKDDSTKKLRDELVDNFRTKLMNDINFSIDKIREFFKFDLPSDFGQLTDTEISDFENKRNKLIDKIIRFTDKIKNWILDIPGAQLLFDTMDKIEKFLFPDYDPKAKGFLTDDEKSVKSINAFKDELHKATEEIKLQKLLIPAHDPTGAIVPGSEKVTKPTEESLKMLQDALIKEQKEQKELLKKINKGIDKINESGLNNINQSIIQQQTRQNDRPIPDEIESSATAFLIKNWGLY